MSLEVCAQCNKLSTPWYYCQELRAHICDDCYFKRDKEFHMKHEEKIPKKGGKKKKGKY